MPTMGMYGIPTVPHHGRKRLPPLGFDADGAIEYADSIEGKPLGRVRWAFWHGEVWTTIGALQWAARLEGPLYQAGLTIRSRVLLVRCDEDGPLGPREVWWGKGWWITMAPCHDGWLRLEDEWCLGDDRDALPALRRLTGDLRRLALGKDRGPYLEQAKWRALRDCELWPRLQCRLEHRVKRRRSKAKLGPRRSNMRPVK